MEENWNSTGLKGQYCSVGTCVCYWANRQGTTGRINKGHETKGGSSEQQNT